MSDHHFVLRLDIGTDACLREDVPDLLAPTERTAVPLTLFVTSGRAIDRVAVLLRPPHRRNTRYADPSTVTFVAPSTLATRTRAGGRPENAATRRCVSTSVGCGTTITGPADAPHRASPLAGVGYAAHRSGARCTRAAAFRPRRRRAAVDRAQRPGYGAQIRSVTETSGSWTRCMGRSQCSTAKCTGWAPVQWFNPHRLPEPIGNIPPVQSGALHHRQQAEPPMTG